MKKPLFIFLLICVGCLFLYLYIDEKTFTPLKEKEFKMIFFNYRDEAVKVCGVDFLGLNFKGELFDFYLYKMKNSSINMDYPQIKSEWEGRKLDSTVSVSKWRNCPIDSVTTKLYMFLLTMNDFNGQACSSSFYKELDNPRNYYSYIYINELENYFLLYCVDKGHFYYIRHKGF
ncbi:MULTISPECIES: hypothetical protein [Bacteroides]|jgi:hypothetical protein|uniref:hypothetical protein n=1 Tax=Bacteroides TaxID=816 RepID=UPI00189F544F|nr:hypothetical protein [Bacteroides nordii]MCE8464449.1 hypothetical protein [Bacteroides nordii]UYU48104.1 hypothetical protein KQP55_15660 [Bacteroides nordii]